MHADTSYLRGLADNENLPILMRDTLRDAAAEIERLREWAGDRRDLQQHGKHPAPCARHCEAMAFEIELRQARAESERLREAIRLTLEENLHLADGDVCTLIRLKVALRPNA